MEAGTINLKAVSIVSTAPHRSSVADRILQQIPNTLNSRVVRPIHLK